MNIEQIAQEVREEMSSAILPQAVGAYEEVFLRRCLSKLVEQSGPWAVAVVDEIAMHKDGYRIFNGIGEVDPGQRLYTEPQLIAAQQRTAEACAKLIVDNPYEFRRHEHAEAIRNGEWREYL